MLRWPSGLGPDAQAKGNIFENRHVPEQRVMLENETYLTFAHMPRRGIHAVENYLPRVRPLQAGDNAQQRGFSATGRTEQGHQLARSYIKVYPLESLEIAETFGDITNLDTHRGLLIVSFAVPLSLRRGDRRVETPFQEAF